MAESRSLHSTEKIACTHLYCGDGKGKTTAAVGLAVRAVGAGQKVVFAQFMKGGSSSELQVLKTLHNVRLMRSEKEFPFYESMSAIQKDELTDIHNRMLRQLIQWGTDKEALWQPDMVILDEITYPYNWGLFDRALFQELLAQMHGSVELILTGRNPAEELLKAADYITEMRKIKHPYDQGMPARVGIEL